MRLARGKHRRHLSSIHRLATEQQVLQRLEYLDIFLNKTIEQRCR